MACPKPHAPTIFTVTSRVNVEAKLRIPETADDSIVEHPFLIVSTMALPQVHNSRISLLQRPNRNQDFLRYELHHRYSTKLD